jgi:hypothetical protein
MFIYVTRIASKEIFSPSNKTHREVGRAKDLSAPRYFASLFAFVLSFLFSFVCIFSINAAFRV